MSGIIRELFNGDIQPLNDSRYYTLNDDYEIIEQSLTQDFNDKQKELFKSYKIARCNYEREKGYKNFKCGFKYACKLIIEGLK
jgi:hypothetical protein